MAGRPVDIVFRFLFLDNKTITQKLEYNIQPCNIGIYGLAGDL